MKFSTKILAIDADEHAPDGSEVRVLLRNQSASMAHFTFQPNQVSQAIQHRSIDEIWYFLNGSGVLWRSKDGHSEFLKISAGTCVSIPVGTVFQIRVNGDEPLTAIGTSTPPWPGHNSESDEAIAVNGTWDSTDSQQYCFDRFRAKIDQGFKHPDEHWAKRNGRSMQCTLKRWLTAFILEFTTASDCHALSNTMPKRKHASSGKLP